MAKEPQPDMLVRITDFGIVRITDLGMAFCEWEESRPPREGTVKDLRYYGELAAFAAGWKAREKANDNG